MVAGHLQEKNGKYQMVLTYRNEHGKKKSKWISTGLPIKGNKKKAEDMLLDTRKNFLIPGHVSDEDISFSEFMKTWLDMVKPRIEVSTYASYSIQINSIICPYFEERGISLKGLTAKHIQDFYTYCLNVRGNGSNSVIHYHANIKTALKYALNIDLIPFTPMDKVQRPKRSKYTGKFYDVSEVNALMDVVKGTLLELPVMLASFYGLRRSEVLGLKWNAIDFENERLSVCHTVTAMTVDGKYTTIAKDRAKNNSSHRSLPLIPEFAEKLLKLKQKQEENKALCRNSYNKNYIGYLCVDDIGNMIKPGYISSRFNDLLKKNNLRQIRFHDLRHTCASLLLANGVSMKEIQEWLGHSDYGTTANTYTHLLADSKQNSASVMRSSGINFACA